MEEEGEEKRLQVYDDVECRRDDDGMIGRPEKWKKKLWIELLISNSDFLIVRPCAFPKRHWDWLAAACAQALGLFLYWSFRMSSSKNEEIEFNVKTSSNITIIAMHQH